MALYISRAPHINHSRVLKLCRSSSTMKTLERPWHFSPMIYAVRWFRDTECDEERVINRITCKTAAINHHRHQKNTAQMILNQSEFAKIISISDCRWCNYHSRLTNRNDVQESRWNYGVSGWRLSRKRSRKSIKLSRTGEQQHRQQVLLFLFTFSCDVSDIFQRFVTSKKFIGRHFSTHEISEAWNLVYVANYI